VKPGHILIALACAAVWGFGFVPSKYGAMHMQPLFFLALRYALIVLTLIWFAPVPRGQMGKVFLYSLSLGVGHFALLYIGLRAGVEATTASVLWLLQVPFTTLLAAFFLKDRPGRRTVIGIGISLAGTIALVGAPHLGGTPLAILLVVIANLMWGVANIQAKRLPGVHPFTLNAWMALFSAPFMIVLSLIFEQGQLADLLVLDWRVHASILYMAWASSIIGYGLWLALLRRYLVSQVAPFLLLVPLFGALSSVLSLGEPVTLRAMLSGAVILGGVALIILRRRAQPYVAPET
jgi:O-acetylserine/cysteine efflux transporter